MHEAALAGSAPSGTAYDPESDDVPLSSLGVHEHWNNAQEKLYSRNLGLDEGIELVALQVSRRPPRLSVQRRDAQVVFSWPSAHAGYQLQVTDDLQPSVAWQTIPAEPVFFEGLNVVSNAFSPGRFFYRLAR